MNPHEANRTAWNEAAVAYERAIDDDVAFLRGGGTSFCTPERAFLQGVAGRVVHLQCAGGRDTLSFLKLGAADVVGVDISDRMIACAEAKSRALDARARFIRADVLDTPHELDGTADWVYTGRGALGWLMDLGAWARVVARLLKPGGTLYVFEGHPIAQVFDMDADHVRLDPEGGDYFAEAPVESRGWPSTYVGDQLPDERCSAKFERLWKMSDIVNAVVSAGLALVRLEEHPDAFWDEFPRLSDDARRRFPNTFSLLARRPCHAWYHTRRNWCHCVTW
jgi:SAM-dependent methyltransferase